MKIVHLLAPARAGGLERVVQGLAIGQRNRGHDVVVAAIAEESLDDHPFIGPLTRANISVRQIIVPHRGYSKERSAVRSLCENLQPDIVHIHGSRPDVVNGGVVRKAGVATVSTCHGFTGGPPRNRIYEYLHRRALRQFDAVIAVSKVLATQLVSAKVPPERVHVVPNAWTEIAPPLARDRARELLSLPERGPVVGWIGRVSREKGVDVLIDAMSQTSNRDVIACVVGDGDERIREQARALKILGQRVVWAGMVPEAGRLCRAFDLFVLSSRTEGIPIALLEAIAAGTPVVATRVGGVPDIVRANEAWLVDSEQPGAIADAIAEALANPAEAEARASRARARLSTAFGQEPWLDQHESIYAAAREVRRERMR